MTETNPYEPLNVGRESFNRKWLQVSLVDFVLAVSLISILSACLAHGWLPLTVTSYLLDVILPISPFIAIALYLALVAIGRRGALGAFVACACICLMLLAVWGYNALHAVYGA